MEPLVQERRLKRSAVNALAFQDSGTARESGLSEGWLLVVRLGRHNSANLVYNEYDIHGF